ncbi:hypothetical protein FA15DRAFT_417940 [Coprinopsis marcescibilis]|uniref:Uncharacterized protein n=1 Tax=Coprinopsis marcescibilis TaxID=230819 RepID=A0A5C3KV42_COPMA|nr:hypothetical protein FA15DRAFT_417940 [Coprinopsis marcescibilis]
MLLQSHPSDIMSQIHLGHIASSILPNGFPRPFLLPKPLEHCTSSELEVLITGWFRDVRDFSNKISPPQTSTLQINSTEHRKLGTIPGGRFMPYSAHKGSVYYQDPQSIPNTPPTMLIRSPFH